MDGYETILKPGTKLYEIISRNWPTKRSGKVG